MSGSFGSVERTATGTVDRNVTKIVGMATGLIAVNILLMLALSFVPPVVGLGAMLFGNFFTGIAVFAVTVGGGSLDTAEERSYGARLDEDIDSLDSDADISM